MSQPITDHDEIAAWLARLLNNSRGDFDEIATQLAPHVAAQIEAATASERAATVKFLRRFQLSAVELLANRIEKGEHL